MNIKMPRGDIKSFVFSIKDAAGEPVEIDFENVYFTVKRSFSTKQFAFQKKLSDGTILKDENNLYHFTILPEDTNGLSYGDYVCDIELVNMAQYIKQTIIGTFQLTDEATWEVNE